MKFQPLFAKFVSISKLFWKAVDQQSYCEWRLKVRKGKYHELEMHLLPALVNPHKVALDIGANQGSYSIKMIDLASSVIAFEPNYCLGKEIKEIIRVLCLPVEWLNIALSDDNTTVEMRVASQAPGLGTIEQANSLQYPHELIFDKFTVETKCLDDYNYSNIGFMKIDVEGHENSVLRGAARTIDRNRCPILIECENRHNPGAIQELFNYMHRHNYRGFFVVEKQVKDIETFIPSIHQNADNLGDWTDGWKRHGIYINNFIFTPSQDFDFYKQKCSSCLSQLK